MYGLGLALLSAVLFGAATPASKGLLDELEPFQPLAGLLYLGAALGMAPLVALQRRAGAVGSTAPTRHGSAVQCSSEACSRRCSSWPRCG